MGRPMRSFHLTARQVMPLKNSPVSINDSVPVSLELTKDIIERLCSSAYFSRSHFSKWRHFLQDYMNRIGLLREQLENSFSTSVLDSCQSLVNMIRRQQVVKIGDKEGQALVSLFLDSQLALWMKLLQGKGDDGGMWTEWVNGMQALLVECVPQLKDYTCMICHRCLYKPTTLDTCGHSFCDTCLLNQLHPVNAAVKHVSTFQAIRPRERHEMTSVLNFRFLRRASEVLVEPVNAAVSTACPTCGVQFVPRMPIQRNRALDKFVARYFSQEYSTREREHAGHVRYMLRRWFGFRKSMHGKVSFAWLGSLFRALFSLRSPLWSVYQDTLLRDPKFRCSQVALESGFQGHYDDLTHAQGFMYFM